MRTYYITFILLLLFFPLISLIAQDSVSENNAEAISLKINLKTNNSYRYLTKYARVITQEMMGNSMEINQETNIGYRFEVVSNLGEEIRIKTYFEEIGLVLETPEGRIAIDSKSDNSSKFSPALNKPFYISITAQGKVIKIEGIEEIYRNFKDSDEVPLREFFTEKSVTELIESSFNIFPADSINMGDRWGTVHSQSLSNQLDIIFDRTFTLNGLSEDMAWLTVENKIKSSASETLAFEAEHSDTTQEGIIEIDRDSGIILFSDIKQEFRGLLKSNGMEIPVKISSEINLKGELIGD